jgi:lipopolysaccharide assembly protein A
MRVLFWAVVFAAAALLSLFAASNREPVSLGLWPLPFLIDAPLYLVVILVLLAGLLVGAIGAWAAGRRRRRELRRCRRRSEALARELAATQSRLTGEAQAKNPRLPATR